MSLPPIFLRVELTKDVKLGPGKAALLEYVAKTGSISAAARAMKMSYRRAWLLIDELNAIFGQPVLTTHVGGKSFGGAELTPFGLWLIERFDTITRRTDEAVRDELAALAAEVRG